MSAATEASRKTSYPFTPKSPIPGGTGTHGKDEEKFQFFSSDFNEQKNATGAIGSDENMSVNSIANNSSKTKKRSYEEASFEHPAKKRNYEEASFEHPAKESDFDKFIRAVRVHRPNEEDIGKVRNYISLGVNINGQKKSYTPLMWAIESSALQIANELIDAGANVELLNKDQDSALDLAMIVIDETSYKFAEQFMSLPRAPYELKIKALKTLEKNIEELKQVHDKLTKMLEEKTENIEDTIKDISLNQGLIYRQEKFLQMMLRKLNISREQFSAFNLTTQKASAS